ncbi:hypothetical protein [Chondromyces apiculatus]|uniref:Peptidase MA-like domain-containing protein n=1 Tax=Chondromyces apiculatus DSM 436 TaxID=1192034 RepID=A0A017T988_9BACT|nr:hypothetical protein [Chondromyces apiculatus]EYF05838.1 Hypothetical protein CAP_2839 [Chondromyces apiculatus DSM 436]
MFAILLAAPRARATAAPRVYDAPGGLFTGPEGKPPSVKSAPDVYAHAERDWITLTYQPTTRDRVLPLINRVDAIREDIRALLGPHALTFPGDTHVDVRIAPPAELDQAAQGFDPGGSAVSTLGELNVIILSAAPRGSLDPDDLEGMLRHALAHLALDQATGGASLPRWFHEGFAAHAAGDHRGLRAQTLSLAALRSQLVPLSRLEDLLPAEAPAPSLAYAEAADFARFLLEPPRRERFTALVARAREKQDVKALKDLSDAVAHAYEGGLPDLEIAWREDVARRYGFLPMLLGALVLLVALCAGALVLRRMRERAAARVPPPRRRFRSDPEAPVSRPSRTPLPSVTPALASSARRRAEIDPDEGVPKVEHGGRWHTLH